MQKSTNNPMQPEALALAPRCLARTRPGMECRSPDRQREAQMQDARRDKSWRAEGQP